MSEELSLAALLRDLRRRWRVALLVAVAFAVGATAYAQSLPNEYQGRTIVAFAPRPDVNIGGDIVRQVLPKYVAYATARTTLERVATRVDVPRRTLTHATSAGVAVDSGNLTITVELHSPKRAAASANAVADEVLRFSRSDDLLSAVLVSSALPPTTPSGPARKLIIAAAVVVGLLLAALVAFVLERGRPRVRSWRDVPLLTGFDVLGRMPMSRKLQSPLTALDDPAVGTAVRTLRTRLERASREAPVHVLLVTSSVSGEGKTTLACLLAASLARLDANVLLVDGDLRRPSLDRLFKVSPTPGLADVLRDRVSLADAMSKTSIRSLRVLSTSPDAEAGDLLPRHFPTLVRRARELVDIVVIDAPPLLGTDDARTLAALSDAVLLVVGVGGMASPVIEAANALQALGTPTLGVVANRSREDRRVSLYGYGDSAPLDTKS